MKLKFGIWNMAYSDPEEKQATTTFEVAEILEKKYHIMGVFIEQHMDEVQDLFVGRLVGELESVLQGKPEVSLKGMDFSKIDTAFRQFLERDEWQEVTGNVIEAAKMGVSHRKGKKKYGSPRPAFIDSGLYEKSFSAWLG